MPGCSATRAIPSFRCCDGESQLAVAEWRKCQTQLEFGETADFVEAHLFERSLRSALPADGVTHHRRSAG